MFDISVLKDSVDNKPFDYVLNSQVFPDMKKLKFKGCAKFRIIALWFVSAEDAPISLTPLLLAAHVRKQSAADALLAQVVMMSHDKFAA